MGKKLSVCFLLAIFAIGVTAQDNLQALFRLGFPNVSNQDFFSKNPRVGRIVVDYESASSVSVAFVYHAREGSFESSAIGVSEGTYSESLDDVDLPKLPKLAIDYMANIAGQQDGYMYYSVRAIVTADSVQYEFYHWYKPDTVNDSNIHIRSNRVARFSGDVSQLDTILNRRYELPEGQAANDSVFNFGGAIADNGSLTDFRMSTGIPSDVSDYIGSKLQTLGQVWYRAGDSDLQSRYQYMRFVCRINKDGSITLLTPRMLRINGGRMPD